MHEFSNRFMRVYNSIPTDIKPLVGSAKLHYVDAFDGDFALLLRERKLVSLPTMFQGSLEVEANMMASGKIKQRVETRKVREEHVPSTSVVASSSDMKFEMTMNTMEKLIYRLTMENRAMNREQNEPHIRNPNFIRPNPPLPPQIR